MSRLSRLALMLLLLLPAGCTEPDGPIPAGSTAHDLGERTFRTYRPASLPAGRPVPLVVVLHGGAGSGAQAERAYGWNTTADREGFVVAYPDGVRRSWNAGPGCCGPATRDGVDDVRFVEDVVAAVSRGVPVDPARVFVTGMSNGAMMAYRLACDSTVFTAIAPVAGTLIGDCPHPAGVSVLHVHGTADGSVPWAGGPGSRNNGGTGRIPVRIDGPAITDVIASWRTAAACSAATETAGGPVTRSVAACPDGRVVELISIAGAGHEWPSATLDATAVIWRFFSSGQPV
jgi:polyhydroxybutyrate depolymerase